MVLAGGVRRATGMEILLKAGDIQIPTTPITPCASTSGRAGYVKVFLGAPQLWVLSAKPYRAALPMPATPVPASFQLVRQLPK